MDRGQMGQMSVDRPVRAGLGRVMLECSWIGEPQLVMGGPDPWPSTEPTPDSCTGLGGAQSILGVPLGLLGWELSLQLSHRHSQSSSSCPRPRVLSRPQVYPANSRRPGRRQPCALRKWSPSQAGVWSTGAPGPSLFPRTGRRARLAHGCTGAGNGGTVSRTSPHAALAADTLQRWSRTRSPCNVPRAQDSLLPTAGELQGAPTHRPLAWVRGRGTSSTGPPTGGRN